jgi:hypothetical protein
MIRHNIARNPKKHEAPTLTRSMQQCSSLDRYGCSLVKIFFYFYGNRIFIITLTGSRHSSYSEPDESNPISHI